VVDFEQQQTHVQQQKLRLAAHTFTAASLHDSPAPGGPDKYRATEASADNFRAYPSSVEYNDGSLFAQPAGPGSAAGALYGTSRGSSLQSLPEPAHSAVAAGEGHPDAVPALVLGLTVLAIRDLAPPELVRRAAQDAGRAPGSVPHQPGRQPMSIAQGIMTVQSASLLPGVRAALLRAPCLKSAARLNGHCAKLGAAPRLLPRGEPSAIAHAEPHAEDGHTTRGQFVYPTDSALDAAVASALQDPPPSMALLLDSRGDAMATGGGEMSATGQTHAAAMMGLATLSSDAADSFVQYSFDGVQAVHLLGAGGVPQRTIGESVPISGSALVAFQVRTHGQGGAEWLGSAYLPLLAVATAPNGQLDTWLPLWAPGQCPDPADVEGMHPDWQHPKVCTGWLQVHCSLHLVSTPCLGEADGVQPAWCNPHPDVTALTAQLAQIFTPPAITAPMDDTWGQVGPATPPALASSAPLAAAASGGHRGTLRSSQRPQSAKPRAPARAVGHDAAAVLPQLAGSATAHQASLRAGHIYANSTHGTLRPPKQSTKAPKRPTTASLRRKRPSSAAGQSGAAALLALSPSALQSTASAARQDTAELKQALKKAKTRSARLHSQLKAARQTALEVHELARVNAPHSASGQRMHASWGGAVPGAPHAVARTAMAANLARDGMVDAAAVVTGNLTLGLAIPEDVYAGSNPEGHANGGAGGSRARIAALQARADTLHKRLVAMSREKERARSGRHEEQAAARAAALKAAALLHSVGIMAQREHWVLHARAAGDAGLEAQQSAQRALQAYEEVLGALGSRLGVFVGAAPPDGLPDDSAFQSWILAAEAAAIEDASYHMQAQADADTVCPPDLRAVYAPEVLRMALALFPDLLQDLPQLQRRGLSGKAQHTLDELHGELRKLGSAQEELALRRALLQQRLQRSGQAAAAALKIDQGRLARMRSRLGTVRDDLAHAGRQEHAALRRLADTVQERMVQRGVAACHSGASPTQLPEGVPYHKPQSWSDTPWALKAVLLAEIEGLKATEREVQAKQHAQRLRAIRSP